MTPARGEVWNVDLDPVRGREQAGRRPALVISVDLFNRGPSGLVVLLPITSRYRGLRAAAVAEVEDRLRILLGL